MPNEAKNKKLITLLKEAKHVNIVGNKIVKNEYYDLIDESSEFILFSLVFYNTAVITTTTIHLEGNVFNNLKDIHGSINKKALLSNKQLFGKRLDINAMITATEGTQLPSDFEASLIFSGGNGKKEYSLSGNKFKTIGDSIELDLSVYFY